MRWLKSLGIAMIVLMTGVVPAAASSADGTLTIATPAVRGGEPIKVSYSTPRPHPANWLGLYADPGDGPVDQKFVGPSLRWAYITAGSGEATLPTGGLEPGDYIVFALAQDGYQWLAEPVKVRITSAAPPHFVADAFDLRNARALSAYEAKVGGLVRGDTDGLTFRKAGGPHWVNVSADGTVTGTPGMRDVVRPAPLRVEARNARGETGTATIGIEVRPPGESLVPDLRTMSFNLWHSGSQVTGGREKELRFLLQSDVDVVGLQETSAASTRELAESLGWDYHQSGTDLGVISRYPITERKAPVADGPLSVATRVRVKIGERQVVVWNVHLGYNPYGPYDACFGKLTQDRLMANEERSGRTPQIKAILREMHPDLAKASRTPVLLTGDFNAPSHLDWTKATHRCGYTAVPWPTSVLPAQAGLLDSYRVANPNPVTEPGITWSPIYPVFTGGYGHDSHKGEPEPQDRIDFVYYAGPLRVTESKTLVEGTPTAVPNHRDNLWTSDHAAVMTTFSTSLL
ncbi:Metal-dependent hydrolase, endonuclease/exonuclease/phosphatase family [Nonomuraea solani]|uniref:Metal-dependent hydrolase, endonuclease/exonuclease/phosphatase family n=1 Tax=Nonomuraea solani TaxID=1144553 RepID=A0A1H6DUI0_9ACTN|nr:endonuclease/exonuclease/phosphatase family protein [Nonomuraea solani]SEG88356.1 Metal-dependent hydrolase, endonuclease/exonuclease/phosphatase family [Nonomuraea solani]